jgi:hypothetical protein
VSKEPWDVFQERVAGSNFAKDSRRGGPAVARIVSAAALPGDAEGLAGEAGSNDIHAVTPGSSVEGAAVVPDREHWQHAVPLASE